MRLSLLFLFSAISLFSTLYAMDEESDDSIIPRPKYVGTTYNRFAALRDIDEGVDQSKELRKKEKSQRIKQTRNVKKQANTYTAPKLPREVANLVLAVVPYKMSMWAVSEVFPNLSLDHPVIKETIESPKLQEILNSTAVQSLFEHTLMRKITSAADSNFVVYSFVIISLGLVPILGLSTIIVRTVRRVLFAISFGLLLASLVDMSLDAVSTKVSESMQVWIAAAERLVEIVVFVFAAFVSIRTSFGWQVMVSILGSIFIHAMKHFYHDGAFHANIDKSFTNSTAVRDTKETAKKVATFVTDAAAKGQELYNEHQNKGKTPTTTTTTTGTSETKPSN